MCDFQDKILPYAADAIAPDGSEVRLLCASERGSGAHFTLLPGQTSKAVRHRSVEEVWFVIAGRGQMWRRNGSKETVLDLGPGISLNIPVGTEFQFRNTGEEAMAAVAVTMPPWPGEDEAVFVDGIWPSST
jgi:mannose-6-phosphate isomerase-like protein (cupin superfamily)